MQQEIADSFVDYQNLNVDGQLIKLFANSVENRKSSFQLISPTLQYHKNRFDHLSLKEAEIQRGYASDESPEKKLKNKKIKKRKLVVPPKIETHKDRATSKFYIESLQNRIQELELQVQRLKSLNKLNLEYIKKINDAQLIINGFFQHRQKIIQKLQKMTNNENQDLRRINSECLSLVKKQGSYGSDRIKAVQYYFKQLVDMIGTISHKYLAEAAFKNSDLFNPDSIDTWEEWRKELFYKLNLSPQTLAKFSGKRGQVMALHSKFNNDLLQLYEKKCSLLQTSRQIEKLFQQMNNQLTPLQTGRLVCFLQKYKFQSDFYQSESIRKMYEELSDHTTFSYEPSRFQLYIEQ